MKTIAETLNDLVSSAFEQCDLSKELGSVTLSNRPDLCHYQSNGAFLGAKTNKMSPMVIANKIKSILEKEDAFSEVAVVAPGFINLSISDIFIVEFINEMLSDEYLGIPQVGKHQTVIIDYGGPNIAKPLHVGHLRSAIIGEAIKRMAKATGYTTIGDIHLGDWGMPIGLIMAELEEREIALASGVLEWKNIAQHLSTNLLNEIYPFASKKSKENVAFKRRAQKITRDLQNGHEEYVAVWKKIVQISVMDFRKSYTKLNVDFDLWSGESDSQKYIPELIEILSEKCLIYKSHGAMVVDVDDPADSPTTPPIIIKKSDGSSLYSTTDLATIIQRQKELKPDKCWYVVDNRQSLHFKQVFRCARKADLIPQNVELEFLGFGTINGIDGKPYKTRDGNVMKLSDLLSLALSEAVAKSQTSGYINLNNRQQRINAEKISVAAIKFGDLINNRSKDYVFDLDKFLAADGKTGAYLLYTVSRINSIQTRIGEYLSEYRLSGIYSDYERQILLHILSVGDVFKTAIDEKSPHYICEIAYQIALSFSKFYSNTKIISEVNEEKKSSWLSLLSLTRTFLIELLYVLGIEPVEHM